MATIIGLIVSLTITDAELSVPHGEDMPRWFPLIVCLLCDVSTISMFILISNKL